MDCEFFQIVAKLQKFYNIFTEKSLRISGFTLTPLQ